MDYVPFRRDDAESLADFLTADDWPFHADGLEVREDVIARVADGYYDDEQTQTFWIVEAGQRLGLVTLEDLGDDTPMFDLRLRADRRGQGIGTAAVRWLTTYLFQTWPDSNRIEAVIRQDNLSMRKAAKRAGYAKESHYRAAWPDADGEPMDAVGYAITRIDWESGTVTPPDWDDEVRLGL
jgi:RimJ/RimL family protein N-acetyltransferase